MNARTQPLTLDVLATKTTDELTDLYRDGTVPAELTAMHGHPACRMLALRGLRPGLVFDRIRRFAAASVFPWAGKAFENVDPQHGRGINRIRLGPERLWYPFDTRVTPSAIDGAPCVLLDYDRPDNPKPIRMIRDELREVAPQLFLGPAMLDTGRGTPRLVLYFACDFGGPR